MRGEELESGRGEVSLLLSGENTEIVDPNFGLGSDGFVVRIERWREGVFADSWKVWECEVHARCAEWCRVELTTCIYRGQSSANLEISCCVVAIPNGMLEEETGREKAPYRGLPPGGGWPMTDELQDGSFSEDHWLLSDHPGILW